MWYIGSRGCIRRRFMIFTGIEKMLIPTKAVLFIFLPLLSVNSIFSFQFWIKIMNFGIGVRIMNAYN